MTPEDLQAAFMMTGYAASLATAVWIASFTWIYKLPMHFGYMEYDRNVATNCFMKWGKDWICDGWNSHLIAGLAPIAQTIIWIILLAAPSKEMWEFYA